MAIKAETTPTTADKKISWSVFREIETLKKSGIDFILFFYIS